MFHTVLVNFFSVPKDLSAYAGHDFAETKRQCLETELSSENKLGWTRCFCASDWMDCTGWLLIPVIQSICVRTVCWPGLIRPATASIATALASVVPKVLVYRLRAESCQAVGSHFILYVDFDILFERPSHTLSRSLISWLSVQDEITSPMQVHVHAHVLCLHWGDGVRSRHGRGCVTFELPGFVMIASTPCSELSNARTQPAMEFSSPKYE